MRVSDKNARAYYLTEANLNNWAVRTLERNINTLYYQRLLSSQNQNQTLISEEMKEKSADFQADKYEFIKNPSVLEFLNLPTNKAYTEQQLDMYVRMFDDLERPKEDNPTIGILLCTETDKTIAKYSVLNESKQLFTSKYLPYLPTEKELEAEIELEKQIFKEQNHS
jgi:hypothetical protein